MKKNERGADISALRPAGVVFAAVVAGLGGGKAQAAEPAPRHAPLEPAAQANTYFVDHTNHPSFEEDGAMIVGESEAVPVFGEVPPRARAKQKDLFEL